VAWQVGPTRQRGRRETEGTGSEIVAGLRATCGTGPDLPPWPFFYIFPLFLFLFLVYFISFSKLVQIDSNQFVNFSKTQHNILRQ
jgi:hypothetical protein